MTRTLTDGALRVVLFAVVALVVLSGVLLLTGHAPGPALAALARGSVGSGFALSSTVVRAGLLVGKPGDPGGGSWRGGAGPAWRHLVVEPGGTGLPDAEWWLTRVVALPGALLGAGFRRAGPGSGWLRAGLHRYAGMHRLRRVHQASAQDLRLQR